MSDSSLHPISVPLTERQRERLGNFAQRLSHIGRERDAYVDGILDASFTDRELPDEATFRMQVSPDAIVFTPVAPVPPLHRASP